MKKENTKSPNLAAQYDSDYWVDVNDDNLMVELGIRYPRLEPKDSTVWTKTPYEKKMLKSLRKTCKDSIHFSTAPLKPIPVQAKLIIQLKKNNSFPKTTYSFKCYQHEIGSILLNFYQTNKKFGGKECLVSKYSFNGKTYAPDERPYWPGT